MKTSLLMESASSAIPAVTGGVNRRMLRVRAVELAGLDGRAPQDASKSDWDQAKQEWMTHSATEESTANAGDDASNLKPFTTVAELDAAAPLDRHATPFAPSADEVAERAYLRFQNQGASDGYDLEHWLTSETELIAEHDAAGR